MPSSFNANNANMGNNANGGNAGANNATSITVGWFFPDRVSLPFVTTPNTGPGAPPQPNTAGGLPRVAVRNFPQRNWAPEWWAWVAAGEFAGTAWATLDPSGQPGWPKGPDGVTPIPAPAVVPLPPVPPATLPPGGLDWIALTSVSEVDHLVTAASNERADALGEIMAQSDEFISWFLNTMTARPGAYPATTLVLAIASQASILPIMHLKALYARPRPSELCPALLPPIAVPGHSSFPSGHSTQAHLMALCMTEVLTGLPQQPAMTDILWTLAGRIARNREIAGLHYRTDSKAGVALAHAILPLLQAPLPSGQPSCYHRAVLAAKAEWAVP